MKKINCVSDLYAYLEWCYVSGLDWHRSQNDEGLMIAVAEDCVLASHKGDDIEVDADLYSHYQAYFERDEVQDWYFTYGSNHESKAGASLGSFFTVIKGTYEDARLAMHRERGDKWSFQYSEEVEAGVERFGLAEINLRAASLRSKQ